MKNLKLVTIYLLFSVLLFSSCDNEDDPEAEAESLSNSFSYDGQTYNIGKGFITDYGANGNGSFDFDVFLTSSTIQYSPSTEDFTGVGDAVYLDLNTSSADGLVNGTYNLSPDREALTFTQGEIAINIDAANNEDSETINVGNGTITVSIEGNISTIDFDFTTLDNKKIIGNFKGELTLVP